jgi:DNA-binding NtrC family response regulator
MTRCGNKGECMKKFLFFDDDLDRHDEFDRIVERYKLNVSVTHAFNVREAIAWLRDDKILWDTVWLDHDMDFGTHSPGENGMIVAQFIALHMDYLPEVVIHSWNKPAAAAMNSVLTDAGVKSKLVEFSAMK